MKLAYVVSFAFPNSSAGTRRVIGICQALVLGGIDVTIYSTAQEPEERIEISDLPPSVDVIYSGDRSTTHRKLVKVFEVLFFGNKVSKLLARDQSNFDGILVYSGYTPILLRMFILKHLYKKKLFFDSVEWASAGRWWYSLYYANLEFANRFLIRRCDGVLCISKKLDSWFSKFTRTVRVPAIYNVTEQFKNQTVIQQRDSSKPVKLLYIGNSDHDHLGLVAQDLLENRELFSTIQLHVAGNFRSRGVLEKFIIDENLEDIIILHGSVSQEDAQKLINSSHFMIFVRDVNVITNAGFPTKFVQAFSSGTPVITNISSDLSDYLEDNVNCVMIDEVSKVGVHNALKRILTITESEHEKMKRAAHNCAAKSFEPAMYAKRLSNFFRQGI